MIRKRQTPSSFNTPQEALAHILKNADTGDEQSINGELFFGMGIYTWTDVAAKAGLDTRPRCDEDRRNTNFINFISQKSRKRILKVLKYLEAHYGFLEIDETY